MITVRNHPAIRAEIYELIKSRDITAPDIATALGYTRSVYHPHLQALVKDGKIYKIGKAKNTFYSIRKDSIPMTSVPEIVLPDMPPLLLDWMGYTNKPVNAMHARHVEGW